MKNTVLNQTMNDSMNRSLKVFATLLIPALMTACSPKAFQDASNFLSQKSDNQQQDSEREDNADNSTDDAVELKIVLNPVTFAGELARMYACAEGQKCDERGSAYTKGFGLVSTTTGLVQQVESAIAVSHDLNADIEKSCLEKAQKAATLGLGLLIVGHGKVETFDPNEPIIGEPGVSPGDGGTIETPVQNPDPSLPKDLLPLVKFVEKSPERYPLEMSVSLKRIASCEVDREPAAPIAPKK